ncbi:DNA helicase [Tanacetum coccineum]
MDMEAMVKLSYEKPSLAPCSLKEKLFWQSRHPVLLLCFSPQAELHTPGFKLPIELTEESLCKVTKNSHLGKLLADTNLIIWDKAPMNDRRCFEALDRSLRDILTMPHRLFGGKSVLLGDDFRQTLPVKKGASKMEVIASCISESELWPHFKVFTLTENMRLSRPGANANERKVD